MSLSIHWDEHNNLTIGDVHWKWHERIRNLMLENYFRPNKLFQALELQNEPDIEEEYRKYVTHFLKNECSIVVLDEKTNEIHGVALLKWMTQEWRSWTQLRLVVTSPKLNELITLRRKMIYEYARQNPKEEFDSLHLFEFYVAPDLRDDIEFMAKFFHAICETTRHMAMPRLTFLALSVYEQNVAQQLELVELFNIIYSMYMEKGRRPFGAMRGIDELNAILYGKDLPTLIPYFDMKGFEDTFRDKFKKNEDEFVKPILSVHSRSRHSLLSQPSKLSKH